MARRDDLRAELLALAEADRRLRAELAADGALFEGYHPRMRALHEANAAQLEGIIAEVGWPGAGLVGASGARAAWLIAQHAISRPALQRRCLALLEAMAAAGQVPAEQPAYLRDRIRALAGVPQIYGTQLDWDEQGALSPLPIEAPEGVDERRAAVGLPPLAEAVAEQRRRAAAEGARPPVDRWERQREAGRFACEVGWRGDGAGDEGAREGGMADGACAE